MPLNSVTRITLPTGHFGIVRIDPFTQLDPRPAAAVTMRWPWQVGAVLEVIAIREIQNGQLWLQLANQQRLPARLISANGREPANGEAMRLRVVDNGAQLVLESIGDVPAEAVLESALRRSAPQQLSPTALLANVQWLLGDAEQLAALPEGVRKAVSQLWQALPEARQLLSAKSLPEALSHSGLMLEHTLATEVASTPANASLNATAARNNDALTQQLSQDIKGALLQLRAQLRDLNIAPAHGNLATAALPDLRAPLSTVPMHPASLLGADSSAEVLSTLKAHVDGYLARLETNQLLTAQSQQQGIPSWLIEVPVRWDDHTELLRFKFEREGKQGEDATRATWSVEIALDMGAQGMLHAQLTLHSTQGLQIKLRSDSANLVGELNEQLPTLVNAMTQDGLHVESIRCLHGLPLRSAAQPLSTLLDIQA